MTKDGSKTIWQYWEDRGTQKPDYYSLCQETVARHNENVRIIGPEDLPELVGELPEVLNRAYVTHKIDWIRKKLLIEQGGVYVDSDFICMRSLKAIQEMAPHFDYVGYKEWNTGGWMDNFMAAKKGSKILQHALDYSLKQLEMKNGKVNWLECSTDAINSAFNEYRWKSDYVKLETHLIEPQKVTDTWWFTQKTDETPNHHCYGFMTSVHNLRSWCINKTREQLLGGEERVCHLFRRAMA